MNDQPLVSMIVCVRNGMPHLRETIESVRRQTYRNYELVIQDGASTDGTREFLESLTGFPSMSVSSEPDAGQGQGFNRALKRCRGEIVGSVDSDNRLKPHAIDMAVKAFASRPDAAVVYGACDMIDADGKFLHTFLPAEFDVLRLLDGTIVPPFGSSYFSRRLCGDALYFDEDFPVVPDFALWLRLADLPIHRIVDVLIDVRAGSQSSTYQPTSYALQSAFKQKAAMRYLDGPGRDRVIELMARRSRGGIYLWVVDSMHVIHGPQEMIDEYFAKAIDAGVDIRSEYFRAVVNRAKPVLRTTTSEVQRNLRNSGYEFFVKGLAEAALVYFELLERSGVTMTDLGDVMAEARRSASPAVIADLQAEVGLRDQMLEQMQEEINVRDRSMKQMHDHLQGEINRRDAMLKAEREITLSTRIMQRLRGLAQVSK